MYNIYRISKFKLIRHCRVDEKYDLTGKTGIKITDFILFPDPFKSIYKCMIFYFSNFAK